MNYESMHFFDEYEKHDWQNRGVDIFVSHPDDEALFIGAILHFVKNEIPVRVQALTRGENGQIFGEQIKKKKTAKIRQKEFAQSLSNLGIKGELYKFHDGKINKRKARQKVLQTVRKNNPAAVFSFHPSEITREFDHPDHNTAGSVTRFAATYADNRRVGKGQSKFPPTSERPHFFAWTTNPNDNPQHIIFLNDDTLEQRASHLIKSHPSQFNEDTRKVWQPIFDDRLGKLNGKRAEMYVQIR